MPDLKALAAVYGLSEDASDEDIIAAATEAKEAADNAKDLGVTGLKLEDIAELRASAAKGEDADRRLRKLEVDTLLEGAVRDFKILPSQKDTFRAMAEANFDQVKAHIEATPVDALKLAAQGFDTPEKAVETKEVKAAEQEFHSEEADAVDTDSAREHVRAVAILREQGKTSYSEEEYLAALATAQSEVSV